MQTQLTKNKTLRKSYTNPIITPRNAHEKFLRTRFLKISIRQTTFNQQETTSSRLTH